MNKNIQYYISTLNFAPNANERISVTIPRMMNAGIKNIEVSSFHPYEDNIDEKLMRYNKQYNINLLVHNFAPAVREKFLLNLCDTEKIFRKRTSDFIKHRIELTHNLRSDYFSFHAGFTVPYEEGVHEYKSRISKKKALKIFIEEISDIVDFAEKEKVHIGVENHVAIYENKDNLLLYDKADFIELFDEIKSKYLHLHLDLGHLKISAAEHNFNRDEFLKLFGEKVIALHVHDNTGIKVDCHAPFSDDFWFGKNQFKYLKNLKYVIFETKTYGDKKLINRMTNHIKSLV